MIELYTLDDLDKVIGDGTLYIVPRGYTGGAEVSLALKGGVSFTERDKTVSKALTRLCTRVLQWRQYND